MASGLNISDQSYQIWEYATIVHLNQPPLAPPESSVAPLIMGPLSSVDARQALQYKQYRRCAYDALPKST